MEVEVEVEVEVDVEVDVEVEVEVKVKKEEEEMGGRTKGTTCRGMTQSAWSGVLDAISDSAGECMWRMAWGTAMRY